MLRIIEDNNTAKVLCNCCQRPFAVVRNNMLVIESTHGGDKHPNGLTPEDLRKMADRLDSNSGTIPPRVVL